ncbi:MAG: hypothetical protein KAT29_02730 [Anaerolineales bacterium]|nr:hypothetical protein [Anaerolineales bacterium]
MQATIPYPTSPILRIGFNQGNAWHHFFKRVCQFILYTTLQLEKGVKSNYMYYCVEKIEDKKGS